MKNIKKRVSTTILHRVKGMSEIFNIWHDVQNIVEFFCTFALISTPVKLRGFCKNY